MQECWEYRLCREDLRERDVYASVALRACMVILVKIFSFGYIDVGACQVITSGGGVHLEPDYILFFRLK